MFLTILHYLSGPVIGAIIGAFTNYIAIKMLFRPLKPVKIGKFTLPFTPGVIPRHQEALAEALSATVYQNFFTNSDIENIFMSEEMSLRFSEGIYQLLAEQDLQDLTDHLSEETKLKIMESGYRRIHQAIKDADLASIVASETENIIRSKAKGGVISNLLLKDEIVSRIGGFAGEHVAAYILEHDLDIMLPILTEQAEELKNRKLMDVVHEAGVEKEAVLAVIQKGYKHFMSNAKAQIAETFHIKEFIYNKIMELDPAEIERLVNDAIKREMNYLVYLGGLLGFIIGIVNIFI